MEPDTGRVVALAEHSQAEPGRRGLPARAFAPAASIFKIVTAAALLEQGVVPDAEVCYHGGRHRLQPRLLADDPRRDHRCATLASAFGRSTNVVFAKLADRGLTADALRAEAGRFLFNSALPVPAEVEISRAEISGSEFELASTAAGFGPVRLSTLHGAVLASIVANRGVLVPPVVVDGAGAPGASDPIRIVDEGVGEALAEMMRRTVTDGTARRAFRRPPPSLRGVEIAGKTGSLADRDPYRDYSWFVGFAPADRPRVAVAVMVANGRLWRVRAPAVAREALDAYFSARLADGRGAGDLWRTATAAVR
jgi:cell division protein FtsI/penicillin-binding protein 2